MLEFGTICLGILAHGKRYNISNGAIFKHNSNMLKVTSNFLWIKVEVCYHGNKPIVKRFGSLGKFKEFLYR